MAKSILWRRGDSFRLLRQRSGIHVSEITKIIRQSPEALHGAYLRGSELFAQKRIQEGLGTPVQCWRYQGDEGRSEIEYYAAKVMESLDGTQPAVACNITHGKMKQSLSFMLLD